MSEKPKKPTHLPPFTLRGDAARELRAQREEAAPPPPLPPPVAPPPEPQLVVPAPPAAPPMVQYGAVPTEPSPVKGALWRLAAAAALVGVAWGARRVLDRLAKRFQR